MFMIRQRYFFGVGWLVLFASFVVSPVALGSPVVPQSSVDPDPTFEPVTLPDPINGPGKESSDNVDKDAAGNSGPGQIVHWVGDGTVLDSFDYYPDGGGGVGPSSFQVDALANIRDLLFLDLDGTRETHGDTVSLVVSFEGEKDIYASRSAFRDGSSQLWALENVINNTLGALDDVDGLEIHGPDADNDANMYSRLGDPVPEGGGNRTSVFRFDSESDESASYLETQILLDAVIGDPDIAVPWDGNWNESDQPNSDDFDVDAMMIWDVLDDDEFGAGDMILFSVRPISYSIGGNDTLLFDGGEIWLYKFGEANATFLVHGEMVDGGAARTWNTTHDVSGHFGGSVSENINAMEAVAPEPSTIVMLFMGVFGFMAYARRRR